MHGRRGYGRTGRRLRLIGLQCGPPDGLSDEFSGLVAGGSNDGPLRFPGTYTFNTRRSGDAGCGLRQKFLLVGQKLGETRIVAGEEFH